MIQDVMQELLEHHRSTTRPSSSGLVASVQCASSTFCLVLLGGCKLATNAASPLQVRIGIANGLVVVGDLIGAGAAQEQAVVGETPNLAARLQALAEPGAVVMGAAT